MKKFKYVEDIDDWLHPMDYQGFWVAVEPYNLTLQRREHCDNQIAAGEVDPETVLEVLKYMVRLELTKELDLQRRPIAPWLKLVNMH